MSLNRGWFARIPHRLTVVAIAAQVFAPGAARAESNSHASKLDRVLQRLTERASETGTHRVIIRLKPGYRSAVANALRAHGDVVATEHRLIEALTVDLQDSDLTALAVDPRIESVSVDAQVGAHAAPNSDADLLRGTLGVTATGPTGAGVRIALIDSGIEPSVGLGGRVTAFYDFTQGGIAQRSAYDDFGHGTHLAVSMGGDGLLEGSYKGVAPRVTFVGLKVLDSKGHGRTSDVIRAVEFATANKVVLGIDIINLSLGHPIYESAATDPLVQAVEQAVRAGIIVVASAGNFGASRGTGVAGYGGITSPGNAPSAITVGAFKVNNTLSRSDDRIAAYSSRGPSWYDGFTKPDVVAPGHRLLSAAATHGQLYDDYPSLKSGSKSARLSGSSMAAGITSAVVALVLEANRAANAARYICVNAPPLTPNTVKAILQFTAVRMHDDLGAEYDSLTQGAGAVNAAGAITLAQAIDTSAPIGSWWLTSGIVPATTIAGESLTWAQDIVWGTNVVWGTAAYSNEQAWATNVVWGTNITWGTNILWGTNTVWGTNIIWSTNIVWGATFVGRSDGTNILWGTTADQDTIVWRTLDSDNILGGTNILWGTLVGASLQ